MDKESEKEKVINDEINQKFADSDTPVYKFEAEASPEEKAKQTLENSNTIGPTATDIDANQTTEEETDKSTKRRLSTLLPGSIPSVVDSVEIPEWARTGWQRVSSNLGDSDKDIFDEILGEKYVGKLWLNATVVFASVFVTYIITSLGGGIGWVIIISAIVGTYFKTSVQRFYLNARDEIGHELAKEKLELYEEPAEWINEFLRRFWLIYEPVLSATIVKTADEIMAASKPSFLESIRLTTFTLGSKPFTIESITSYPKSEDDVVVMDWKVSYIPNDIANMTRSQLTKKVNPKIVLTVRLGKGISAGVPILLEDMSFSGLIRVKLKLINIFPHVKTVDISFLEEPKFDYVLKPIGGETFGFDIANLPGLSSFIQEQVHANLRPLMYAPNVYTIDAELLVGGYPIETAIGVLKLTIFNARGLRNAEKFGTSDPYVKVKAHGNIELAKTKVIDDSLNPAWNETHFLVLTSLNEFLRFEIWDSNGMSKDKPLGTSNFELQSLLDNPKQENITTDVLYEGKPHGEIKFDAVWYPVAEVKEEEPAPESNVGILRFNIHRVKSFDHRRNAYAKLLLNGNVVFTSKTVKRKKEPVLEDPFEMFITNRAGAKLAVNIYDARDLANDPIIGKWESTLEEFLANSKQKIDWFNLDGAPGVKINLTCLWKPVMIDDIPGPGGFVEPRGFVRLHVKGAKELKNLGKLGGKSDPYVKVLLGSTPRGRSDFILDNLSPVWDEIFYIPVHSTREVLSLQVMDREINAKDKRLGFAEVELSKLIKQQDGKLEAAESMEDTSSPLLLNRESRGTINYSAAFYSTTDKKELENINILDRQTGIFIVYINRAKFEKRDTSVDIYVDNGIFPVYTTNRCKKVNPQYDEVTDVLIKELDVAKLIFHIKQGDNRNPIGIVEQDAKGLLENCLSSSQEDGIDLPIEGMNNATLNVYIQYMPVEYKLQPSESISNMGDLQVAVKNAVNLPGADRSGTSDPFVVFTLNNKKVFTTKTIKKNCNPEFNESFDVTVLSRSTSVFELEVFDWNQIGNSKKIASGSIQLDDLPLFERAVKEIQLKNELKSSTPEGGKLTLHIVFRPSLVGRKKQTSGVVDGATRVLTGLGSEVTNAGTFVGSKANSLVSGVGSGFGLLKKK